MDDIPFPFEPYPSQRKLMADMVQVLEEGKIGCFESPTGTVCREYRGLLCPLTVDRGLVLTYSVIVWPCTLLLIGKNDVYSLLGVALASKKVG